MMWLRCLPGPVLAHRARSTKTSPYDLKSQPAAEEVLQNRDDVDGDLAKIQKSGPKPTPPKTPGR